MRVVKRQALLARKLGACSTGICVYVCVCMHMCVYALRYMCIHTHALQTTHTYVCVCVCVNTYTYFKCMAHVCAHTSREVLPYAHAYA